MGTWPNLIIVGAMKCGSTSLHNMLDAHPDIHMSEDKELNYFIKELNYSKGEAWYTSHFKEGYKYNGESSIGYTKKVEFPGVAKRIFEKLPNAKLIYLVREPVQRSISHYLDDLLYKQNKQEDYPDVNDVLNDITSHVIQCSSYSIQLSEYLNYFNMDQIKVLKFETMKSSLSELSKEVGDFLNVKEFDFSSIHANSSSEKKVKNKFFKKMSNTSFYKSVRTSIPDSISTILSQNKLIERITKTKLKEHSFNLREETVQFAQRYFKDDLMKLEEITGLSFADYYSNYS
jgi:hypothetical protein